MDLKFSLLCVWIQTMFITSHAEVTVDCPPKKIIETKTVTLSCTVKCKECTTFLYKWSNATGVMNKHDSKDNIENYKEYYYTIKNPLVSQSGNYTFWIQTNKGPSISTFKVTIERGTSSSPTPEQMNNNDVQQNKKHTDENGSFDEKKSRSTKGAAAVLILILAVVLPIIFIVAFKKSTTFRSRVTSWFSCSAQQSQSEHVEYKCAVEDDCKC